ncbi:Outer membrane porin protein precursor [Azoarcus sp. Aa7]|nr:Outer membrane porin protein precursor [Azoarcus sp. Aa7]
MQHGKFLSQRKRTLAAALAGILGSAAAMPALADTEIEALKRELAEQKKLIERLLTTQQAQQEAIAKTKAEALAAVKVPTKEPVAGQADSSLTVYGVADVNIASMDSGFGQKTTFGSGGLSSSRLGVKGERALGDGWKAVGLAEAGLLLDTGSVGNAAVTPGVNNSSASSGGQLGNGGQIFSRQVYAGLASDRWGSFTIGRQYSGSYAAVAMGNAMGVGLYGYSGSILPAVGMPTRVNNAFVYLTPRLNGFSGHFTYTTGSENNVDKDTTTLPGAATKTNDKAGRGLDLALTYTSGPFNAMASAWDVYNASYAVPASGAAETGLARKTGWQLGGSYDFGAVKLFGQFVTGKISGSNYENVTKALSKSAGWSVSALVPLGKHRVYASYTAFDDKSRLNKDAQLVGLGYSYDLYANTKLYAGWGKMINNENASYSLANGGDLVGNVTTRGFDPEGYMAGVNVAF